jgi:FMN phosphatase YigB (HAD superfamily)
MSRTGDTIAVVFLDLGNTLIDYHSGGLTDDEKDFLGLRNMVQVLHGWDSKVGFDDLYDGFYMPWRHALRYRRRRQAEISIDDYLSGAIAAPFLTGARHRRLLLAFHEPFVRFSLLHAGTVELLAELGRRGKSPVLVANSPIPGFCHDAALRKLGILHCFSLRQYSYDAGVRKPNERFFQLALRRARTDAARGAMVGDSWSLDIEPALRLGMQTFWYRPNAIPESVEGSAEHAAHIIRRLADVPPLLQ